MAASNEAAQAATVAFLSSPDAYGEDGGPVRRLETHISTVFLAGARAYKLKRAVRFPYLDYRNVDDRQRFCEREVEINRHFAPGLYEGVLSVTRSATGALALDGVGEAVDWLVVMRRFDQDDLLDRRAALGTLDAATMVTLADGVAEAHLRAQAHPDTDVLAALVWAEKNNARALERLAQRPFTRASVNALVARTRAWRKRHAAQLAARAGAGHVRACHGDLHLGNICLWQGRPTPFDAIEFDPRLSRIDVLYDLAFLLMNLDHRGLGGLACIVLSRYLARTDDYEGLALLPYYLASRATIRAHTRAAAGAHGEARRYLDLAHAAFDAAEKPVLVALSGMSGSGKSSQAAYFAPRIGPRPGAVVIQSDVIRKHLFGVPAEERLGADAYTSAVSADVYRRLLDRCERALEADHAVIADATFVRAQDRVAIEVRTRARAVPFAGLWLAAPAVELGRRVDARRNDPSDATRAVLADQLGEDTGPIAWLRIDAGGTLAEVHARIAAALAGQFALRPLQQPHRTEKETLMTLKAIRLELARGPGFPQGSGQHGYRFRAPLDGAGRIDLERWRKAPELCTVVRFWGGADDEHGQLVRTRGDQWAFSYAPGEADDEPIFRFAAHPFVPGEYLTIAEHDGETHTFRVAAIDDVTL